MFAQVDWSQARGTTSSPAMASQNSITLKLPAEFLERCKRDGIKPQQVLRGFIADLCEIYESAPGADGYCGNGSDERDLAQQYYGRAKINYLDE